MARFLLPVLFMLLFTVVASAQIIKAADNTQNAGKVEWSTRQILLEDIPFGIPATRELRVKNISRDTLHLLEVKPSCLCTTAEYNHNPVPPGETRIIKITYDAAKPGEFYRIVSVKTNFDPNESVAIVVNGNVLPRPSIEEKQ